MVLYRFTILFICLIFLTRTAEAQAPERINYQAVARNILTGTELVNVDIFLSAQIRQGGPNGTIIYQESHAAVGTDDYGLFSIQVGGGDVVTGNFAQIPWADGNFWLQIDIDAGEGLQNAGAMQFLSVPYALHAHSATNVDDADADPANELVEALLFDPETRQLSLGQEGGELVTDLGIVVESLSLNPENYLLSLTQQGPANQEVDLSPLRAGLDNSEQNELINPGWPVLLPGNILQIREADVDREVDLSPLIPPNYWELNNDETSIFNSSGNVGIGTENATAKLEVRGNAGANLLQVEDVNNILFSVQDSKIGIGGETGTSDIHLSGSVSYAYRTINTSVQNVIDVGPNDYVIVINVEGAFPVFVNMPNAALFPGRVIILKKLGLSANITIFFNEPLDSSFQSVVLTGFQPQIRSYMSIGDDGWILLNSE